MYRRMSVKQLEELIRQIKDEDTITIPKPEEYAEIMKNAEFVKIVPEDQL